jgi:hypothetical protein
MPDISTAIRPPARFVERVYAAYERNSQDWRRPHLGASLLGNPCRRALWFSFRWAIAPRFPGRVLRLFDTGNREEGRIVADLRNAGITVFDRDPSTGAQFRVSFCEHSGGSLDGIACGFEEAPKKWHVVEFKTHNEKSFAELKKVGVSEAKPYHYAQMQVYMYKMNEAFPGEFDRAMYIAVNKNTDEIYGERVRLDHMAAQALIGKAIAVVDSPRPAGRLSDDTKNQACLFCEYHGLCFGTEWKDTGEGWSFVPFSLDKIERNCRTCLHSTPCKEKRLDGSGVWKCAFDDCVIAPNVEKGTCEQHLFVPDFLRVFLGEVVDASLDGEFVRYSGGVNYKGGRIEAR